MKFAKEFRGVPTGEIYPVEYQPGDTCPPELEAGAIALGALEEKPGVAGKPSAGLNVEQLRAALTAKAIPIPSTVTKKDDLAALLDSSAPAA
jgi:hypothetical protein